MFSDFQRQLTYYGVLDDVVDRYPWPSALNLHAIQHQLITSAMYGKRILINDGYLVANPMLIGDLSDIGHSLTGTLLRADIARLFSRSAGTNLAEGIERTAPHVASHRALVSDPKRWPLLRSELENLSSDVGQRSIAWPRDKNMGQIFYLLMERVAALSGRDSEQIVRADLRHDFDAIFARFKTLINETYDGARNYWEEACWTHIAGRDIDPHALGTIRMAKERVLAFPEYSRVVPFMNIANEIYHLAYSAGASRSFALGAGSDIGAPIIGVATAFVTAFPDLAREEAVDSESGVDAATLERMNQLLVTLPSDVEFGGDFSFVYDMRRKTEVLQAAKEYLDGLELFSRGGIEFAEAIRRRDAYIEQLANVMASKLRFKKRWVLAKGFSDLLLAGATSPLHFGAGWLLSFGLDPLRNRLIERMLKARVSSALREQGMKAASDSYGSGGQRPVPLARQLGLYLGPLRDDGMKQLVSQVGPHPAARPLLEAPMPTPAQTPKKAKGGARKSSRKKASSG